MTASARPLARSSAAEAVVLDLLRVLLGDQKRDKHGKRKDYGLMSLMAHGFQHTPRCPHGQWLSVDGSRPHGDPCSDRCRTAHAAIRAASIWLKAHGVEAPVQAELWEAI